MTGLGGIFADRITDVPRSFIREILKVGLDPQVISFAGGLPNRDLFPVEALREATCKVFEQQGRDVLQYASSEGSVQLREHIAARYREREGLQIPVDQILVTHGSQQGLDLLGKILLNEGDALVIEEPGYLGAIQAFSLYRPRFLPVPLTREGMDPEVLGAALSAQRPKLIYTVPNFQNPSGLSYPEANRRDLTALIEGTGTVLIEDDPYGELRFAGRPIPSFRTFLPDNTVLLGSFSKTLAPGLRLGWIVAPPALIDKLVTAKQATDLHTSGFTQSIVCQYLDDGHAAAHVDRIRSVYGAQCRAMLQSIRRHFPAVVTHTEPEGGMFVWAELPEGMAAVDLFDQAVHRNVVFVPGDPFYVRGTRRRTLRLNFSCTDAQTTEAGIYRLAEVMQAAMRRPGSGSAQRAHLGVT